MEHFVAKAIAVFVLSSLKYLAGIIAALSTDFNFGWSVLLTVAGGMAGVVVFSLIGKTITMFWHQRVMKKKPDGRVKFTKFKRWLVKLRQKHGILGIALLTPPILQVPIGTL